MSGQPIFSEGIKEDLIDCMEKSGSISTPWLISAIQSGQSGRSEFEYSKSELMILSKRALAEEAVFLMEEHFNGKAFSIDYKGEFTIDLDELKKEREIVEHKEKIQDYNGFIVLGITAGENVSIPKINEFFRNKGIDIDNELLRDPCDTPNGASIRLTGTGISVSNVSGKDRENLLEGFDGIAHKLPRLRGEAINADPSNERKQELDTGMSYGG